MGAMVGAKLGGRRAGERLKTASTKNKRILGGLECLNYIL